MGGMGGGLQSILIVEDNYDLRSMFRQALVFAGFVVREAGDGMEALRQIEVEMPDLIVLDLALPWLGGAVVAQDVAAHAHTKHIPIVVVTASRIDVPEATCVLRKPVMPDALVKTVRQCLGSGAPGIGS
jgi:DNA-binding response OmpR family regulator